MERQQVIDIISLVENSNNVFVSSVAADGYPNTKAMMTCKHDGHGVHYFSTNTSSLRKEQFQANNKACIYFCDESSYHGLMLLGTMEVCLDVAHKELLWREGDEQYYPLGVTDPDYCVFKFTTEGGRYYPGERRTFSIEELKEAELSYIMDKFAESGWDLITAPAKEWLQTKKVTPEILAAIEQANKECGSCGCEYDKLYPLAISYLKN